MGNPGCVFDLRDAQLLLNTERVQKIPAEHEGIDRRIHGVYPTGWYKEGFTSIQLNPGTFFH